MVTPLPPVEVRPQAAIYPPSLAVDLVASRLRPGAGRAMDWPTPEFTSWYAAFGLGAPLALVRGFETPNGFNPLDIRHYREFIRFTATGAQPVEIPERFDISPVLPQFRVQHPNLFDLLVVRYLVCPPEDAEWFRKAGWRLVATDPGPPRVPTVRPIAPDPLPPHGVYENPAPFPRAFLVPQATAMPAGREAEALWACDFRRVVLLAADGPLPPDAAESGGTAEITDYRPDRVAVQLDNARGGFLVLADVWFPGWVCRIDGQEVPVYRANHAFRAVPVPAGAREVVFTFEPRLYRAGWWVSAGSAALLLLAGVLGLLTRLAFGRRPSLGGV